MGYFQGPSLKMVHDTLYTFLWPELSYIIKDPFFWVSSGGLPSGPRGQPQFLAPWTSSTRHLFHQAHKESPWPCYTKMDPYIMGHTDRSDIPLCLPYPVVRNKSQVLPTLTRKALYKDMSTRSRRVGSWESPKDVSITDGDRDSRWVARPSWIQNYNSQIWKFLYQCKREHSLGRRTWKAEDLIHPRLETGLGMGRTEDIA